MKNRVGKRVKRARERENPEITQLDLIARLGILGWKIDQAMLSKIENGTRKVSDIEVVKLARALRVTTSWLLGERDQHR